QDAASAPSVVVFTGGGTIGHVSPGIAVLQALGRSWGDRPLRVVWIGSEKGIERPVVEALGIEYRAISTGKLRRYFSWQNFTDLVKIARGYFQSRKLLKDLKPAFVFSKGGFVSVPPVRAARALGIPVYSHESDLDPGLATRLNLSSSRKVFCAYAESVAHFPPAFRDRVVVAGNPVRSELFSGDPGWVRRTWNIPEGAKVLLVLGGSQGARQVNELVAASLDRLQGRVFVIHQTGQDWQPLADGPWYASRPFFRTEMPDLYAGADLIFGRAGAGTLWESAAAGKPLVLLPLGAGSRGDQVRNAELFEARGAARVLGADPKPGDLVQALEAFLGSDEAYRQAQRALSTFDAAAAALNVARVIGADLGGSTGV
ncbi:MAG TPA: UDP-N-acetylglucosamine--N-acetylmuramyl-(pentapeptide) pyrophosphoryl-undecaprenol N-acetylglucosamine transferase, partial [Spirochaetia bacterium]|nr:UDP-N-acetylglucosamine--N-acetylmuramyl-(pentapeptide) pyrophosphoryl-undecaprenol N-acetylglucosamine transferase [Spirochaetia bacterium]